MKMQRKSWIRLLAYFYPTVFILIFFTACSEQPRLIKHGKLVLNVNDLMQTKVTSLHSEAKPFLADFSSSETLQIGTLTLSEFKLTNWVENILSGEKSGKQWIITGLAQGENFKVEKRVTITAHDGFEDLLSFQVTYSNQGGDLQVRAWSNHNYEILNQQDTPPFWAFQGSSTSERKDWVLPLAPGFYQRNYMGMNDSDYGGGIPVTDIWRKDAGIAIGHLAPVPKLVSLPTEIPLNNENVKIKVTKEFEHPTIFKAGESIKTIETFVMVHSGDYYNALSVYSELMQSKGIKMAASEGEAFESIWCSWGYERTFTAQEVLGTLPKVKELGIKWAVLDDGFQIAEGDWNANPKKYPRGDIEIRELVDGMHAMGLKAKIWWTPLAADPTSKLLAEQPDMRLFQSDWSPQFITWWDAYYLSPVNPTVIDHTQKVLDLFLNKWDFDGLKMDGQHMNAVLPDHNPASELDYPEQSVEGLPNFFQMIYDESRKIKPHAVIENCPCGTCMSFYNMVSMNQAVASDPNSLWQIRHRGKTYKALIPQTAYYADHVEQVKTDGKFNTNFATALGVGAVLGTKFTWPKDNPNTKQGQYVLTPEKELIWKKWFALYDKMMLSKEGYLGNLYDIGYDLPETHVIKKGDYLYFSFYNENWSGPVEFRGLATGTTYELYDYANDQPLGMVDINQSSLDLAFSDYLLVQAKPIE
ncbi:alpha-galactosidase [Reichenbachiella faecimaris]|uniref:Alpha-galactosidase n=1 Tax=Reichenbachiella faecimaris TaxID=692418 RepID=A0A1W2G927_REIFA|nr:glycoside hydrolase family 36 protein [Reichenbachiella faecimaris]SMD32838.1 alpha-galactosidase [Reichenbachiella faecimaris]